MERQISLWCGWATGSFVDRKSVLRLAEWVPVGKREDSNKEPRRNQRAGGQLITAASAGDERLIVIFIYAWHITDPQRLLLILALAVK